VGHLAYILWRRLPKSSQGYFRLYQARALGQAGAGFSLDHVANFTDDSRAQGQLAVQHNAQEAVSNKQTKQLAALLRRDGFTLAAIAAELNAHGYLTRRGKQFNKKGVLRLLTPAKVVAVPTPLSE
jgi:hypothetical protein